MNLSPQEFDIVTEQGVAVQEKPDAPGFSCLMVSSLLCVIQKDRHS
jgi:hypothetical protein